MAKETQSKNNPPSGHCPHLKGYVLLSFCLRNTSPNLHLTSVKSKHPLNRVGRSSRIHSQTSQTTKVGAVSEMESVTCYFIKEGKRIKIKKHSQEGKIHHIKVRNETSWRQRRALIGHLLPRLRVPTIALGITYNSLNKHNGCAMFHLLLFCDE